MANVQKQLVEFHEAIQLTNLDENDALRKQRDLLLDKLRNGLKQKFAGSGRAVPTFQHRNQGSYAMHTGIKPVEGREFDIDVALLFNIDTNQYPDPTEIKTLVVDALNTDPHSATIQRPCVTVRDGSAGDKSYHVDFPIYASPSDGTGLPQLALGFPGSEEEKKEWQPSDFLGLIEKINARFDDSEDILQFRRIVRYLKRWKDVQFSPRGEGAPRGIGLTVSAFLWLEVHRAVDPLSKVRTYDDLGALLILVDRVLSQFTDVAGGRRLSVPLPTAPFDDPFARMSPQQVQTFEGKLRAFHDALRAASREHSLVEACRILNKQFGDDFPVPKAAATVAPAVISTAQYA